ncbi:PAS domain S-box protein [Silvimonas sp.]|uniref:PAS domain S-box protein n=1 Tax=Silvimonas sp. TaxID=2650811 RepID=UPI002850EB46|nr:PAS domain S-box protein [Silvimonas sp.]MDR3428763.1 PAS domain S-box protein [Silvimonas sp.]
MSISAARLRVFVHSSLSSLATQRGLLVLVLLVEGACAATYLYLEHNWIEAGVVRSLKNVSSMHRRSFEQLEATLDYQLAAVGEAIQARGIGSNDPLVHALLQNELKQRWVDAIAVLDPTGNIIAVDAHVSLASAMSPGVLAAHSFKDSPRYQAFHDSGAESDSFFVSRPQAPELGGGGITMYRRVTSLDGHALGTVVSFTSLRSLSALLNTDAARGFDLGKDGVLSILDGHSYGLIYRYANAEKTNQPGNMDPVPYSAADFKASRYGPDVKSYRSPVDGLERLAVLMPQHDGQWLQVVAASKNEYLFNWRIQVAFSVVAFACLCLLQWLMLGGFHRSREQRALLDLVLDSIDANVYFKSIEGRLLYVNAKTAAHFAMPADQLIGRLEREFLPQETAERFNEMDRAVITSGKKHSDMEVVTMPNGQTVHFASIKVPVQLPGQPPSLIGISTDVTELHEQTIAREAAEKELAAHNHSLLLNNQVLEKLDQNASLPEVLDTMARIIDEYRPGMPCAIFLVADDGQTVTGCAAPNLPKEWLGATVRLPIAEMNGSSTAAVRSGETVIVEDVATHPCWSARRETALGLGLRASWSQPITGSEGNIRGAFTLYKREPAAPDAHDLVLLADYARLAQMVIERARLAEALRESQALYRLMAENSNDVVWVIQYPALHYSYISPSVERLRGWTQEEILSHSLARSLTPGETDVFRDAVEVHIRRIDEGDMTARLFGMELEVRHKDGHFIPVEVVVHIMLDSTGRPTHIVGSTRDITARKAAENEMHQAREQLSDQLMLMETLVNAMPSPVFAKDRAGRYLMCNTEFEEYAGKSREEVIGKGVFELWPPELAPIYFKADNELFNNPRTQVYETKVQYGDGSLRDVLASKAIFRNSAGDVAGLVGVMMDISERKVAEEVIRNMAFFDQLTGLPNRRMLEDRLGQTLALAQREQRKLALLFVDLDRFKAVNDQHGHQAGDWLLKQVAARMDLVLRESDTAARIGGDEFIILLPVIQNVDDAIQVAEKIRVVLEEPFVMDDGVTLDISSSIGVVMYPDQADNLRDLLHFGDEAMYRAKKGGKNAVEVFTALAPQPAEQDIVHPQGVVTMPVDGRSSKRS